MAGTSSVWGGLSEEGRVTAEEKLSPEGMAKSLGYQVFQKRKAEDKTWVTA